MALQKIKMLVEDEYRKKGEYVDMPIDLSNRLVEEGKAIEVTLEEEKKEWWEKNILNIFDIQ